MINWIHRISCYRLVWGACAVGFGVACTSLAHLAPQDEYKSGIVWPEPPIVAAPPQQPPSDAIVLFDGSDMSAWEGGENWIVQDGYTQSARGDITTRQGFGDCQLHLEFATPADVSGSGQGRGNSGVYMMNRYEIQVLDSYENKTYFDGQCAAIYKQSPPIVNACRGPSEWQSYDIIFTAPRFDDAGELESAAYVTVLHNGVLVHNHFELLGGTFYNRPPGYSAHPDKLPIKLQFHGNPVRFRNIWVRENVHAIAGKQPQNAADTNDPENTNDPEDADDDADDDDDDDDGDDADDDDGHDDGDGDGDGDGEDAKNGGDSDDDSPVDP